MELVKRIENWSSGTTKCVKCGGDIVLWFNGGELDTKECCGHKYSTEHQRIDLCIYKKNDKDNE